MISTWIINIDTKVSFALALTGVLIGTVFSKGLPSAWQKVGKVSKLSELSGGEILAAILVGFLYIVSLLSILHFMFAIRARVKNINNASSIYYFGSISKMKLQDYKAKVNKATVQQMIKDLNEQIHTNSMICNKKAKCYNIATKFLLSTIVLWFICMMFGLI